MENKKEVAKQELIEQESKSPAQLMEVGLARGIDSDKLNKFLDAQIKWEANEARKKYHIAMSNFKANPPKITKDKQVAYKEVRYKHASLANITDKINAELSKQDLSASWLTNQTGDIIKVTCIITHAMGHSERTELSSKADLSGSKNPIQAIGSTITYLQRYTLLSLTGLATSEGDDDGKASEVVKTLTLAECGKITDLMKKAEVDKRFLAHMKVKDVTEIAKKDYARAVQVLETRIKSNADIIIKEKKGAK